MIIIGVGKGGWLEREEKELVSIKTIPHVALSII
jgi:hypothetical protein